MLPCQTSLQNERSAFSPCSQALIDIHCEVRIIERMVGGKGHCGGGWIDLGTHPLQLQLVTDGSRSGVFQQTLHAQGTPTMPIL